MIRDFVTEEHFHAADKVKIGQVSVDFFKKLFFKIFIKITKLIFTFKKLFLNFCASSKNDYSERTFMKFCCGISRIWNGNTVKPQN